MAVLSGATVTVKNMGTGRERTGETGANGSYAVPELAIGTYTVTLTSDTIESRPVNGHDCQKLICLNPGGSGSPDQITDSPGSYGALSMNGRAAGRTTLCWMEPT